MFIITDFIGCRYTIKGTIYMQIFWQFQPVDYNESLRPKMTMDADIIMPHGADPSSIDLSP